MNWEANASTRFRSSNISLLSCRPLRKSFCFFPCSLCTARAIWAALRRKRAIISKSDSTHPLDVIAGVPESEKELMDSKTKWIIYGHQHKEPWDWNFPCILKALHGNAFLREWKSKVPITPYIDQFRSNCLPTGWGKNVPPILNEVKMLPHLFSFLQRHR